MDFQLIEESEIKIGSCCQWDRNHHPVAFEVFYAWYKRLNSGGCLSPDSCNTSFLSVLMIQLSFMRIQYANEEEFPGTKNDMFMRNTKWYNFTKLSISSETIYQDEIICWKTRNWCLSLKQVDLWGRFCFVMAGVDIRRFETTGKGQ